MQSTSHLDFDESSILCEQNLKNQLDRLTSTVNNYLKVNISEFAKVQSEICSIKEYFTPNELTRLRLADPETAMEILGKYLDFINYNILKFVIDVCGNEELQKEMDAYIDALHHLSLITLVTKQHPPSNFSVVVANLSTDFCVIHIHRLFEYRQKLLEAWKLEIIALRIEKVDTDEGIAMLSFPRQYVPMIVDILNSPQVYIVYRYVPLHALDFLLGQLITAHMQF